MAKRSNSPTKRFTDSLHWCKLFEEEVQEESPRAMAILGVAVLEESLASLLKGALLPCPTGTDPLFDGPYAPLGSFSAKIDFASRMGLFSAVVTQSLHLIRRIRNDFAHDITQCTFDQADIRNRVRELKRLNDVAKPNRRAQFPDGVVGDFQAAVSWLIFWLWHQVDLTPRRCPECGLLHLPKAMGAGTTRKKKAEPSTAKRRRVAPKRVTRTGTPATPPLIRK